MCLSLGNIQRKSTWFRGHDTQKHDMPVPCWGGVIDGEPTMCHHWINISCLRIYCWNHLVTSHVDAGTSPWRHMLVMGHPCDVTCWLDIPVKSCVEYGTSLWHPVLVLAHPFDVTCYSWDIPVTSHVDFRISLWRHILIMGHPCDVTSWQTQDFESILV